MSAPRTPIPWRPNWRPAPSTVERDDVEALETLLKIVNKELPFAAFGQFEMKVGIGGEGFAPDPAESDVVLEEVRVWAADGLHQLGEVGVWNIEPINLGLRIGKAGTTCFAYTGTADDFTAPYKEAIKQLLIRQAWRVCRCARAKCHTLFIRRGRSEYCTSKCSGAERAARVYQKRKKSAAAITQGD
jgi:hypothetical protein